MFPLGRIFGMSPIALMREFTDEMDRVFRGQGNASEAGVWSPPSICNSVMELC